MGSAFASCRSLFRSDTERWIVVEKPAGVPTLGAEPSDLVTYVRRSHGAVSAVFALERDVSGLVPFARGKRAADAVRKNATRMRVDAVIDRWPALLGDDGAVAKFDAHFRVIARSETRALIRVEAAVGATSKLRDAIGAMNLAVVGDVERGGVAAHRVMLHVSAIEIDGTWIECALPSTLRTGFERGALGPGDSIDAWAGAFEEARARRVLTMEASTDAVRIANDAGDGVPGVTLDRYGDFALVQFYRDDARDVQTAVLDAVERLGPAGIYVTYRPKQSNTLVSTRRDDLAPSTAVRGRDAPSEFIITERDVQYFVRLGDGLSTGIFLDQRENRSRVRTLSRGARVLNLFAYTGAFTVAAATGGARATVSVDVSRGALETARRNLELNGIDPTAHARVVADAFAWLEGAHARRDRFDLVILDPPSYSTTHDGTRFSSESDYRELAARAITVVAPGGQLLACSNHRGIVRAKLRRHLHEAARDAKRTLEQLRDLPDPTDFPPPPGREPHLKSLLARIA